MLRKLAVSHLALAFACAVGSGPQVLGKSVNKDDKGAAPAASGERLYLFSPERGEGSPEIFTPPGPKAAPMPEAPLLKVKADGTLRAKAVITEPAARRD